MTPMRSPAAVYRLGAAIAFVLMLAGCTHGGQFDPTEVFSNDMFASKSKIQGQREPLFPNGVPGAETGVPPDLVKGYKAPDQDADSGGAPDAAADKGAAQQQVEAKPPPKPKPKPKLARAPAPQNSAFDQKPPPRISIGPKAGTSAQQGGGSSQAPWPGTLQGAPAQQAGGPRQSVWPAAPSTAPGQQAAQPAQSIWPNPPASGTLGQ